jgi:hypothetical protein
MPPLSLAGTLSDAALLARVSTLAERERHITADLIASLAELDTRRLYLGAGCVTEGYRQSSRPQRRRARRDGVPGSRARYIGHSCPQRRSGFCRAPTPPAARCRAHNAYEAMLYFGPSTVREQRLHTNA